MCQGIDVSPFLCSFYLHSKVLLHLLLLLLLLSFVVMRLYCVVIGLYCFDDVRLAFVVLQT